MNALKEFLLESIQKTYIFEMAVSRKELKDKVDNLIYQIIEDWCLVKYCTLYDNININKNHWQKELRAHILNIYNRQLKGGDNSAKFKLIEDVIIDKLEITTANKINRIIKAKFRDENLNITSELCNCCIEELYTIMQLMSNKDNTENFEKIFDYVDNL